MRSVTDQFLAAVRQSRVEAFRITSYPADGSGPYTLAVGASGGQVTLDRTAEHRGSCSITIADPTLYPDRDTGGQLDVYGCELHVERGIRFGDASVEYVSLGWYRVQTIERTLPSTGSGLTVTGWDRSQQVADQRFLNPRTVGPGRATDVIQTLITEVFPAAVFHVTADTTTIPATALDRDRWPAIQQFAQTIGYEVYADADGEWVIQPIPDPSTDTSVFTVDAGVGGVLVTVGDSVTRDGVPNAIMAHGQPADGSTPVAAFVTDSDPTSPTYWDGSFGHVPYFYSSPLVRTTTQATKAATAMLNLYKGAQRSIDLSMVPNPALEPDDCILVVYPDGKQAKHVIDSITIPVSIQGQLQAQTRLVGFVDS